MNESMAENTQGNIVRTNITYNGLEVVKSHNCPKGRHIDEESCYDGEKAGLVDLGAL